MRANITTNIVVTLVLSPEEAAWLHKVMQNPLHGQAPWASGEDNAESSEDTDMRSRFFHATKPN